MTTSREWRLAHRPDGWPKDTDVELVTTEVPAPGDGEVLVRNVFMSVDPYMRTRMDDAESYVPPFELGEPLDGAAIGRVVDSRAGDLPAGTLVAHQLGWREYATVPAAEAEALPDLPVPPSTWLGALGMNGLTAYVGLTEVAPVEKGDVVFVSGAAGANGSAVGQIARALGAAKVIGSAGSDEKGAYLTGTLGYDAAVNYKDGSLPDALAEAAPDGIDLYFDNVGGDHLEAAIGAARNNARMAICGAISGYNETEAPAAPRNLDQIVGKRLRLRGFIVLDHDDAKPAFVERMGGWLADGTVRSVEDVVDGGIEAAYAAFLGMLGGRNTGKTLVRLAPDAG